MEERPFDSLERGLNRDLRGLLAPEESNSMQPSRLGLVFGMPKMTFGLRQPHMKSAAQHPFESLSDRFAHEIAVFPLADHVVINRFGAFIPQAIFGANADLAYKEERNVSGTVNITVHPKQAAVPAGPRAHFGSARGLIKISDDFDEPLEDFTDYM